jgi:release factor glutamine methyltransferase
LLIALLHEFPEAHGTGIDLSSAALDVAAINAHINDVAGRAEFRTGSWFEPLRDGESFDLIVSNPPYIPANEIPNLDIGVRNHDPILALDGGEDGLKAYKEIFSGLKNFLRTGGVALLEAGIGQAGDMARLAANAGFDHRATHRDFGGVERVVEIAIGDK